MHFLTMCVLLCTRILDRAIHSSINSCQASNGPGKWRYEFRMRRKALNYAKKRKKDGGYY
ncbi:predicted protein [Sclerotinia sclerotiorum 1980 UF-70]|uniref:Secreted protein n=1 Tax=Sclerotinia sclerotiorum (strain ATCC 18683 / 1980 / Ss-1) TaxID=665079 RepID=A7E5H1_SCLS1|nr:predicted protein [Sclerotinia sclerotiorum 1980 UF-70]EDN91143.1 predicted protein [Sclerotinia sclerotiorum 1980 UF-70]